MPAAFESMDEFRATMETVLSLTPENLYGLVAGRPTASTDWTEITQTVADAGFALSWLTRELEQNAAAVREDRWPVTPAREADPRWQRAQERWRNGRTISFKNTDPPPPRPAI
jgi:hypothetical protein